MSARPSPGRRVAPAARPAAALLAWLALSGCATIPPGAGSNPADPWERFNRHMFGFNEALDQAVIEPVAKTWRDLVPQMVRTGVGNFFGNLGDIWSTANHFLQGKVGSGFEMGMRVLSNTFIGLGGLLDPATEMRLPRRSEDFGQTLGAWGIGSGPYLVLPLLGPSSLRDAVALPLDRGATATRLWVGGNPYLTGALQLVNVRAELLATTQLITDVSLDKYSFVRDGYLARRLDQVYDGAPPLPKFDDDFGDPPPPKK